MMTKNALFLRLLNRPNAQVEAIDQHTVPIPATYPGRDILSDMHVGEYVRLRGKYGRTYKVISVDWDLTVGGGPDRTITLEVNEDWHEVVQDFERIFGYVP